MPSEKPASKRQTGLILETFACRYLQRRGLNLITKNYVCRGGEIDLIMMDQHSQVVFLEVRYRSNSAFGSALESVNYHKQNRVKRAAKIYVSRHPNLSRFAMRFDVVAYANMPTLLKNTPIWIKGAFE